LLLFAWFVLMINLHHIGIAAPESSSYSMESPAMTTRLPKLKGYFRRCQSFVFGFRHALALPGAAVAMEPPAGGSGPASEADGAQSTRQKRDWLRKESGAHLHQHRRDCAVDQVLNRLGVRLAMDLLPNPQGPREGLAGLVLRPEIPQLLMDDADKPVSRSFFSCIS
jgi:hypothetical protein